MRTNSNDSHHLPVGMAPAVSGDIMLPITVLPQKPSTVRMFKEVKRETVDQFERDYLLELLQQTRSSLAAMSRASGLSRKYLRILLRKHDLRDQVGTGTAQVVGQVGYDPEDDPFNF